MFSTLSVFQIDDKDKFLEQISGQQQNKCLVILPESDNNESITAFLTKIFAAVQLDLSKDIAVFSWKDGDKASLMQLLPEFQFETCILFGVPPLRLGLKISIEPWKIIRLQRFSLLYCESLTKIAADQTLKKHLWDNLKQLWK